MCKKIILSIKPKYVQQIIKGTKKYEYRTKVAKHNITSILIYESYPIKKVVAEVEVLEVLEMTAEDLWNKTCEYSGTSKEYFDEYFRGRNVAYAYKLGKITVYEKAKDLFDFGIKYAPQSFVYL